MDTRMIRSKAIRSSARGESCTVMSPVCNGNPETVVWAHSPFKAIHGGGMSLKPHDIHGCYACSACHDWIDGRLGFDFHEGEQMHAFMAGNARSLVRLIDKGIVTVKT